MLLRYMYVVKHQVVTHHCQRWSELRTLRSFFHVKKQNEPKKQKHDRTILPKVNAISVGKVSYLEILLYIGCYVVKWYAQLKLKSLCEFEANIGIVLKRQIGAL